MTDVKHMRVIGNLLINYLNFFIKRGSLRNGHNRERGRVGVRTKKRVLAAEQYWTYIGVPPPLPMSSRIYIFTKILSRSFIY